jgi:hypothetical protein
MSRIFRLSRISQAANESIARSAPGSIPCFCDVETGPGRAPGAIAHVENVPAVYTIGVLI